MMISKKATLRNTVLPHLFDRGRLASLMLVVFLVAGTALTSSAQDAEAMQELKDSIKREILQELRGETALGSGSLTDIEKLKDEIKRDILEEFRKEQKAAEQAAVEVREELKKELRQELMKDLGKSSPEPHPQAVHYASGGFGSAQGQMLRRGTGLAACRVKLVKLLGASSRFRGYTEDEEYETLTDKNGMFHFVQIPIGNYKMKWELPGDRGWIRRIRDEPDVSINAGQLSTLKAVETARPLLPR